MVRDQESGDLGFILSLAIYQLCVLVQVVLPTWTQIIQVITTIPSTEVQKNYMRWCGQVTQTIKSCVRVSILLRISQPCQTFLPSRAHGSDAPRWHLLFPTFLQLITNGTTSSPTLLAASPQPTDHCPPCLLFPISLNSDEDAVSMSPTWFSVSREGKDLVKYVSEH